MQFIWKQYKNQYDKLFKLKKQLKHAEIKYLSKQITLQELNSIRQEKHNIEKFLTSCEKTFWQAMGEQNSSKSLILDLDTEVLRFVLKKYFKDDYHDNIKKVKHDERGTTFVTYYNLTPAVELTFDKKLYYYKLIGENTHFANKIYPTFDLTKYNPQGCNKDLYKKLRSVMWDCAKIMLNNLIRTKIKQKQSVVESCNALMNQIDNSDVGSAQLRYRIKAQQARILSSMVALNNFSKGQMGTNNILNQSI